MSSQATITPASSKETNKISLFAGLTRYPALSGQLLAFDKHQQEPATPCCSSFSLLQQVSLFFCKKKSMQIEEKTLSLACQAKNKSSLLFWHSKRHFWPPRVALIEFGPVWSVGRVDKSCSHFTCLFGACMAACQANYSSSCLSNWLLWLRLATQGCSLNQSSSSVCLSDKESPVKVPLLALKGRKAEKAKKPRTGNVFYLHNNGSAWFGLEEIQKNCFCLSNKLDLPRSMTSWSSCGEPESIINRLFNGTWLFL